MPKFTRKPTQVDAIQFRIDAPLEDWPEGVEPDAYGTPFIHHDGISHVVINGDWLITEPDGSCYPVRADKFLDLYEKAPE